MDRFLCIFLKYDYGIPERGVSLERKYFFPAIQKVYPNAEVLWIEEHGFLERDYPNLQKTIISTVQNIKPKLTFFVLMNNEITSETLAEISKKTITINWFSDDHWRFESWSKYISKNLHYAITVDKYCVDKYLIEKKAHPILSQWGYFDAPEIKPQDIGNEFKYDITFVGTKNSVREWYVEYLKSKGINVICFGSGWDNGRISFEEMTHIFLKSRINLNLSNSTPNDIRYLYFLLKKLSLSFLSFNLTELNTIKKSLRSFFRRDSKSSEQMKARNFEIPSAGGLQLTHYTLELEDYFSIGKEIAIYGNCDEMHQQIAFYLNAPDLSQRMRTLGFDKAIKQSFASRISAACRDIQQKESRSL
jgi:spore maturation protein CgeB